MKKRSISRRKCDQNLETKLNVTFEEARITQHAGKWGLKSERRNSAKDIGIYQIIKVLMSY